MAPGDSWAEIEEGAALGGATAPRDGTVLRRSGLVLEWEGWVSARSVDKIIYAQVSLK